MEHRPLGNSGLNASVVGLGTWVLGGGSVWGQDTDDQESIRAIHAALDAGINLIDASPAYGWGRSEEIVAQVRKDARGGELEVKAGDPARMRRDVAARGVPCVEAPAMAG